MIDNGARRSRMSNRASDDPTKAKSSGPGPVDLHSVSGTCSAPPRYVAAPNQNQCMESDGSITAAGRSAVPPTMVDHPWASRTTNELCTNTASAGRVGGVIGPRNVWEREELPPVGQRRRPGGIPAGPPVAGVRVVGQSGFQAAEGRRADEHRCAARHRPWDEQTQRDRRHDQNGEQPPGPPRRSARLGDGSAHFADQAEPSCCWPIWQIRSAPSHDKPVLGSATVVSRSVRLRRDGHRQN